MITFQVHPFFLDLLLCSIPVEEPLFLLYCLHAIHLIIPVPVDSHNLLLKLLHVWLVRTSSNWLYFLLTHPHHSLSFLFVVSGLKPKILHLEAPTLPLSLPHSLKWFLHFCQCELFPDCSCLNSGTSCLSKEPWFLSLESST